MAKTKLKPAPILAPLRTEYGAGLFPGFPRTIEGGMKSMWMMIVDRREYNNGVIYDRHAEKANIKRLVAEPKKEIVGRIRMTPTGWIIECDTLLKGRKIVRRVK